MNIRAKHNLKISKLFVFALLAHLPIFAYLGIQNNQSWLIYSLLPLIIISFPSLLLLNKNTSLILPNSVSVALISFSGILIHLAQGQIEMHFHIFVSMAALVSFGLLSPILTSVAVAAIHHFTFFFFLPSSVFNYQASIWIVFLHALFVIICAVPTSYVSLILRQMILTQDTTMISLGDLSDKLVLTSKKISKDSEFLKNESEESTQAATSTSEAVKQATTSVKVNSENTVAASDLSLSALEKAKLGQEEVKKLHEMMGEMNKSSQQMKEIMNLIDDISFQTNLLSLNAAVEAARAGDSGKGFAVVAEAVRNLSVRATDSTKEIHQQITQLLTIIQTCQKNANNCSQALTNIVDSISKVMDLNQKIAVISSEQKNAIDNINTVVVQVDSSAKKTLQATHGLTMNADEILRFSYELEKLMDDLTDKQKYVA